MSVTIKGSNLLGGGYKVKTLTLAGSAPASILAQSNTQIVVKLANAAPKQGLVVITADTGAVVTSAADAFEYVGSATTTTTTTSTPKQLVPDGGNLGLGTRATTKAPVEADSGNAQSAGSNGDEDVTTAAAGPAPTSPAAGVDVTDGNGGGNAGVATTTVATVPGGADDGATTAPVDVDTPPGATATPGDSANSTGSGGADSTNGTVPAVDKPSGGLVFDNVDGDDTTATRAADGAAGGVPTTGVFDLTLCCAGSTTSCVRNDACCTYVIGAAAGPWNFPASRRLRVHIFMIMAPWPSTAWPDPHVRVLAPPVAAGGVGADTATDKAALEAKLGSTQKLYDAQCKTDTTTAACKELKEDIIQTKAALDAVGSQDESGDSDGLGTAATVIIVLVVIAAVVACIVGVLLYRKYVHPMPMAIETARTACRRHLPPPPHPPWPPCTRVACDASCMHGIVRARTGQRPSRAPCGNAARTHPCTWSCHIHRTLSACSSVFSAFAR